MLNTIELETSTMIGPKLNQSILPGKFHPYCPQDFDVRLSHLHEIGKKEFETQGKQSCIFMIFAKVFRTERLHSYHPAKFAKI